MTEQLQPAGKPDGTGEKCLEQTWSECRNRLVGKFRQWLNGDHAAAEDLFSQATVKLLSHGRFDELDSPVAWLTHVAWNLFVDGCRQRKREQLAIERMVTESDGNAQHSPSVEEQMVLKECFYRVDDVVETLPLGQQQAFRMHIVNGMDYCEVAGQLKITHANARKRVQLARALLRREVLAEF